MPENIKTKIKQEVLVTLGSPTPRVGLYAAQVVAALSAVELPVDQWPDLIQVLLGFVNTPDNAGLKIATLSTIGYICESIVSDLAPPSHNAIIHESWGSIASRNLEHSFK